MINKVKELRTQVPIPMGEAMQLLKENDGDVEKCVYLFKAESIKQICELTRCDEELVAKCYEEEKLDFNRTVSTLKELLFDRNYTPLENVTIANIKKVHRWLDLIEEKDFITSIDYQFLDDIILILSSIPSLKEISGIITRARMIKDSFFEGYSDSDSMEEFVRRNRLLDDNIEMQTINNSMPVKITLIDKELSRHLRNLYKKEAPE